VTQFINQLRACDITDWQEAQQALAAANWEKLAQDIHRIKGPFRLIQASDISEACQEVEDLCADLLADVGDLSAEDVAVALALMHLRELLDAFWVEVKQVL
jgi:HPt (histidine-containing phosphotransfer) domain-containing protein